MNIVQLCNIDCLFSNLDKLGVCNQNSDWSQAAFLVRSLIGQDWLASQFPQHIDTPK
jgi:hypothetical protein